MSSRDKVAFFDELGLRYEEVFGGNVEQIKYISESLDLMAKHIPTSQSPVSTLDIGCGTGKPTGPLVVARGYKFHGFDFSSVMIDLARTQVPEGTFECVNLLDFEPHGHRYDAAFAIFSLFSVTKAEMHQLAGEWGKWVKPGGFLFIGTMDVDAFPQGTKFDDLDSDGGRAKRKMMGDQRSLLVWTQAGWKKLLQKGGFELLSSELRPFQPSADSEGDWEPHLYLTCRKASEVAE